jgi:hypothetical protein
MNEAEMLILTCIVALIVTVAISGIAPRLRFFVGTGSVMLVCFVFGIWVKSIVSHRSMSL